jgi:hypothetical protein
MELFVCQENFFAMMWGGYELHRSIEEGELTWPSNQVLQEVDGLSDQKKNLYS